LYARNVKSGNPRAPARPISASGSALSSTAFTAVTPRALIQNTTIIIPRPSSNAGRAAFTIPESQALSLESTR
jgi:hypothetical protein